MKLLIELPTWLGDAVMTTPALENLFQVLKMLKLQLYNIPRKKDQFR